MTLGRTPSLNDNVCHGGYLHPPDLLLSPHTPILCRACSDKGWCYQSKWDLTMPQFP